MKTKMAGKAVDLLQKFFKPALANDKGLITANSVIGRFAPDVAFGTLAAVQTPGDAFDKGTAFLSSSLGGGLGGATLTGLTRGKLGAAGELVGGLGGDFQPDGRRCCYGGKDRLMGGEGLLMGADEP